MASVRLTRPDPRRIGRSVSLSLVLGSLVLASLAASPARAVPGLELSTPFPAVVVEPGGTASFTLGIDVETARRVDLAVDGLPEGWEATFRGGGLVVDGAFVRPDEPPEVTLDVDVPDGATGTTRLTVRAASGQLREQLVLDLRVAAEAAGSIELTSDFPQLQGAADDTYTFNLTLSNDTPAEATFGLSASGPEGWDVTARPSGQDLATSTTVDAGSTGTVVVEVDPPDDVATGVYPINATASGAGQDASIELAVGIEGSFSLELSTPDERLNATVNAGTPRTLDFVITNTGTGALTNVTVSGTPPTGWTLDFGDQVPVAAIPPEQQVTVQGTLTPSGDALAGDYQMTVTATATEANDDIAMRLSVETSPLWGFLGIGLIVVTLVALFWVFRTYGRR